MSVFTTVTLDDLQAWLKHYPTVGAVQELKGIAAGITNTNYFVITEQARYVLTLFEHHGAAELPYFLNLMAHLATHGIACPAPVANSDGQFLGELNGKPAALVSCLRGKDIEHPSPDHCTQVGDFLAQLHLAGLSYPATMQDTRGPQWCAATAKKVMPHLDATGKKLLQNELEYQAKFRDIDIPRGVIHADLFRDNVLFDAGKLSGAIDFYYACNDALAYDLAITVNDWCVDGEGELDNTRLQAMMSAYQAVRPLTPQELQAWPVMLRAGALRFWLSRLHDLHFPIAGEMTHAKDPQHFRLVLEARIAA